MKRFIFIIITALNVSIVYSFTTENTIIIGGISGAAPYCYSEDESNPDGFATEVVKNIMNRIDIPYEFKIFNEKNINNNGRNEIILSQCDLSMIAIPSITDKRQHYYSTPYSQIHYYIISCNDKPFIGLKDLEGKTVIARKGSSAERKITALSDNYINKIISVLSVPIGLKMLTEGVADYLILDDYSLQNCRRYISSLDLHVAPSNLDPLNISIASNDGELIRKVNSAIMDMKEDGTLDKIYNKWLVIEEISDNTSYLYAALLLLLAIICLALLVIFTLRKVARKAESNAMQALLQNQKLVFAINLLLKNSNTEILMFNETLRRLYVLKDGIFVESDKDIYSYESLIHPDDLEQYRIDYNNIITAKTDYVISSLRIFDSEINEYKHFEYTIIPAEKNSNGMITSYYYSRRDVTSIMKELRSKEQIIGSFSLAIRSANLLRWRFDIKDYKITLNYNDGRELVLTQKELLSNVISEDVDKLSEYILREINGNDNEDIIIRAFYDECNEYRICKISSLTQRNKNGKPESIFGVINDITDITKNHQKLKEVQRSMQAALDAGQMTAWKYDKEDDMFVSLYGPNIFDGKITLDKFLYYVHPDDKDVLPSALDSILCGKNEKIVVNFRVNPQSKGYKWYTTTLMPVKENGDVRYVTGTRRDITQEMEYRIELEKGQTRLQTLLDKIPTPVYIVDPEKNIVVYSNNQAQLTFGIDIGVTSIEIYQKELGEEFANNNQEVLNTGKDYTANETLVFKNGEIRNTLVKKTLVNYKGTGHILISRIDLTEQERMSRAQKLVSTSLPAFNAFTWSIDGRNHCVLYNDSGRSGFANINEVNTIDKCMTILHPEDRIMYKQTLLNYIERGKGEFNMIYRSRASEHDSYEWWETRGIAETIEVGSTKYTILYGITINITTQKLNELSLKDSQNKLIEINKQNELILNNTSSGIVYINSEFEVLWSNVCCTDNLKLPPGLFEVGSKCHMIFGHCNDCEDCPISSSKNNYNIEPWTRDVDLGDDGIYHIQTTPVIGENGIEGAVLRIDNITERAAMIRDLEREKERVEQLNVEQNSNNELLSTIIERFPGILFIKDVDNNFKYLFASAEFCTRVVELPSEKIIERTDFDIFSNRELAGKIREDDLLVAKQSEGNTIEIGEEIIDINGDKRIFHTIKLAVRLSNKRELLIGSSVDITNLKKINEDLIFAREKAEESERLKMAFLANMSHEIRTPLNAIVGFSELLQYTTNENDKAEYINIININNELLLRLIGDILDLSKIESGTVDLEPEEFDFTAIAHEIYATWQQRSNPNVEFTLESTYKNCFVTLDKNRVIQVITNYISNAFKYTPHGKVTMGYTYEDGGVKVYVKDTGIGIPKNKHSQTFERFAKFDDFAQGTGLGLAICKAITEACGGKTGFNSIESVGSTFWAWFPCEARITKKENESEFIKTDILSRTEVINKKGNGYNILVVEDNESNYMLVKAILNNYNLTRVTNGADAINMARNNKYDAILMDIRIPVINGLEATRQIRLFDTITPIIAVTANAFNSDRIAAKEVGCSAFVSKPIKRIELEEILKCR